MREEDYKTLHETMIDDTINELILEYDINIEKAVRFVKSVIHTDCTKDEFKHFARRIISLNG
jgi:hypothetical protein